MVWLWRLCGSDNCSESQIPECKEEVAGVKKTCIMLHKVGKVGEELVTESRIGTLAICKRGHKRACTASIQQTVLSKAFIKHLAEQSGDLWLH